MKHFYALITPTPIEFSPVAFARDHSIPDRFRETDWEDEYAEAHDLVGEDETYGAEYIDRHDRVGPDGY